MFYSNIDEVSVKASYIALAFELGKDMALILNCDMPLHFALADVLQMAIDETIEDLV